MRGEKAKHIVPKIRKTAISKLWHVQLKVFRQHCDLISLLCVAVMKMTACWKTFVSRIFLLCQEFLGGPFKVWETGAAYKLDELSVPD